jgi:hypothetical protein
MNIYYLWLLLLMRLSVYSKGPQHAKLLDAHSSSVVTLCSMNFCTSLALGLPQNEVPGLAAPLWVPIASGLPHNKVYYLGITIPAPLWARVPIASGLPHNEVYVVTHFTLNHICVLQVLMCHCISLKSFAPFNCACG